MSFERSQSQSQPKKRAQSKANTPRACASCRKAKTRCEVLGSIEEHISIECHRCCNIGLRCSYTELDATSLRSFVETYRAFRASRTPSAGSLQPINAPPSPDTEPPDSPNETLFVDAAAHHDFFKLDHMWSFVRDYEIYNWFTPLTALDTLSRRAYSKNIISTSPRAIKLANSLDDIVTDSQKKHLISLFQTRYLPWLNISLIKDKPGDQILDLVCCTIASRDLDGNTRSQVSPRLRKLTTDSVTQIIFNANIALSLESVQAFLILSLWAPISGDSNDGGEGTILITTAIKMATQLHLDTASTAVNASRATEQVVDPYVLDKARLWAVLTNVESLLCFGTGRNPSSHRSDTDTELFPWALVVPPVSFEQCCDTRLKLTIELFTTIEENLSIRLHSLENIEEWHDTVTNCLIALQVIRRFAVPLKLICQHDKHFHETFSILVDAGSMMVAYQALYDLRLAHISSSPDPLWFLSLSLRTRGSSVVMTWGVIALNSAETILMRFLQADPSLFIATPDHIFGIITFAVGICVGLHFLAKKRINREFAGWTFQLIEQTVNQLRCIAISPDHPAARCAYIVAGMAKAWRNRANPGPMVRVPTNSDMVSSVSNIPDPALAQIQQSAPTLDDVQSFEVDSTIRIEDGQNLFDIDDTAWNTPMDHADIEFWSKFFSQASGSGMV